MAELKPFRGIRFEGDRAGDLSLNLSPTYVLSESEQDELYRRSPHNVIRLELAYDWGSDAAPSSRYVRAAETQREWLEQGVLARDETPAMYVVEESFDFRGGEYRRIGLLAAVRVAPYETGAIVPHEHTEPGPAADRLALMKAARTNFSPLMVLYRDGRDAPVATLLWRIARRPPDVAATPPGQPRLRMWRETEQAMIGALCGALQDTRLLMADGHHRYRSALDYSEYAGVHLNAARDGAAYYRIMTLIDIDDPGLFLLGYHRAVEGATSDELESLRAHIRKVCELREWRPPRGDAGAAFEHELARAPAGQTAFGVVGLEEGSFHVATMPDVEQPDDPVEATDYARLHHSVLGAVFDPARELRAVNVKHDAAQAVLDVVDGRSQMAFVMRPVRRELVETVVSSGRLLPVKSTYFHPKLAAGLVMQSLEGEL